MAITFPVPVSGFASRLRVSDFRWQLREFPEISGTAIGQVIVNEIAERRWRASVKLARMSPAAAADIQATIEAIGPSGHFLLCDPSRIGPALDPSGAALGSSDVTIHTIGADNRSLRLQGLPAGYVLSRGDMLSIAYGASPVRRMLARAAEAATASGAGITPLFEVRPFLRNGVAVGQTVTLVRPAAKVIFEPGSFDPGTPFTKLLVGGMTFTAIEVR